MHHPTLILATVGLMLGTGATCPAAPPAGQEIDMFASPKTVRWVYFSQDPASKQADTWTITPQAVVCRGTPLGYLRTEQDFTNFILRLQWRRPAAKKPGGGGVLIRMTGKDKIWPKSLEAQLNAGAAGDFWGLAGYRLEGPAGRFKQIEHKQFGTLRNLAKTVDAELPPGQWNDYEIIARGPTVTLKINGRLVNQATACDPTPGKICLTAEGDEIHFRNVRITPLSNQPQ